MSDEHAAFIREILKEAQDVNQNNMLPFLMSISSRISGRGMELSDEETSQLIRQLTSGMPPREQKRVEMLHRLSVMLSKKSPRKS